MIIERTKNEVIFRLSGNVNVALAYMSGENLDTEDYLNFILEKIENISIDVVIHCAGLRISRSSTLSCV